VKGPDPTIMRDEAGFHPIATWPLGTSFARKESRTESEGDLVKIVSVSIDR